MAASRFIATAVVILSSCLIPVQCERIDVSRAADDGERIVAVRVDWDVSSLARVGSEDKDVATAGTETSTLHEDMAHIETVSHKIHKLRGSGLKDTTQTLKHTDVSITPAHNHGHSADNHSSGHHCKHDEVLAKAQEREEVDVLPKREVLYNNHPHVHGRLLSTDTTSPMRIKAHFIDFDVDLYGHDDLKTYIENDLVPTAISFWSQALSVVPVAGALKFNSKCRQGWGLDSNEPVCSAVFQAMCNSIPVSDDLVGGRNICETLYSDGSTAGCRLSTPNGPGAIDTDLVLFVTVKDDETCGQGTDGTQAYALSCDRDQFDRPTFGHVNVCKSKLSLDPDRKIQQLDTLKHEIAHVLGFSSSSWQLFRNPDGTPRTPREHGQTGKSMPEKSVLNTVESFAERGMDKCEVDPPRAASNTRCVMKMVTPAARAKGRDYFACETLSGVEIENQPTSGYSPLGSHWEQRILDDDLMASTLTSSGGSGIVSPMTLAAFEDSGWYTVNYSMATRIQDHVPPSAWGYQSGCDFVQEKCVVNGVVSSSSAGVFCATPEEYGCSVDHSAVAKCVVREYPNNLPQEFQYFDDPRQGGQIQHDYCPTYEYYSNTVCTSARDLGNNVRGQIYGKQTSRCFASALLLPNWTTAASEFGCYDFACVCDAGGGVTGLRIMALQDSDTTQVAVCTPADSGKAKSMSGFEGTITCPDDVVKWCSGSIGFGGCGTSDSVTAAEAKARLDTASNSAPEVQVKAEDKAEVNARARAAAAVSAVVKEAQGGNHKISSL